MNTSTTYNISKNVDVDYWFANVNELMQYNYTSEYYRYVNKNKKAIRNPLLLADEESMDCDFCLLILELIPITISDNITFKRLSKFLFRALSIA